MPLRQLFFIESRLLGEAPRGKVFWHEQLAEPPSDLFYCPICGEVWAKFPILRDDGSCCKWQSYSRMCRKCGPKHQRFLSDWPGSVTRTWDREYMQALPVPVLVWELERHIESWERIPHGYK